MCLDSRKLLISLYKDIFRFFSNMLLYEGCPVNEESFDNFVLMNKRTEFSSLLCILLKVARNFLKNQKSLN